MPDRHDGFIWALVLSLIINLLLVSALLVQRFGGTSPGLQPFVVSLSVRQQTHPDVTTIAGSTAVLPPTKRKNAAKKSPIVSAQSQNITPALPTRGSEVGTISKTAHETGLTSYETGSNLPNNIAADQDVTTTPEEEISGGLSIFGDKTAGDNYTAPEYLVGEKPPYPKQAKRNGWAGTVLLTLSINAKGEVEKVGIAKSSGYKLLDQQARQSVSAWRFKPAQRNGMAIAVTVQQPIIFSPTPPGQDQ